MAESPESVEYSSEHAPVEGIGAPAGAPAEGADGSAEVPSSARGRDRVAADAQARGVDIRITERPAARSLHEAAALLGLVEAAGRGPLRDADVDAAGLSVGGDAVASAR